MRLKVRGFADQAAFKLIARIAESEVG